MYVARRHDTSYPDAYVEPYGEPAVIDAVLVEPPVVRPGPRRIPVRHVPTRPPAQWNQPPRPAEPVQHEQPAYWEEPPEREAPIHYPEPAQWIGPAAYPPGYPTEYSAPRPVVVNIQVNYYVGPWW
jgi:hypothetical protein